MDAEILIDVMHVLRPARDRGRRTGQGALGAAVAEFG
jgi:hypothetical protein